MKTVSLYGGAITCQIPERFLDCSEFRQVPDHQEVFIDKNQSDQSIIFEILEQQNKVKDDSIAQ